jgi:zinc/manganese transport system permease protein
MNETLTLLKPAAIAALVMAPLHAAFGLHVIRRGVIFIDLAVAQVAAFGIALSLARGVEGDGLYWAAVTWALVGAALISLTKFKLVRIPHEAMIGIIFVVGSAASLIALGYADHGQEEIKSLLDGQILFVQDGERNRTAVVYFCIAAVAAFLWKRFTYQSLEGKDESGVKSTLLDFVFYALIGIMVASSVRIAGVLLVFTWLVMPAVIAWTWCKTMGKALLVALPLSWLGSLAGMYVSVTAGAEIGGWGTGASIVVVFGALVFLNYLVRLFVKDPQSPATSVTSS